MKIAKFLVILFVFLFAQNSMAQVAKSKHPDVVTFIQQVTKISKNGDQMKQMLWFPKIYWEMALKDSPQITPEIIDEIERIFENYEVFIAYDITFNSFGIQKREIKTFQLNVDGKEYKPVDDYPADLEMIINFIKPLFKQMMGQMGESLEIFIFDNHDKNVPSPYEKGEFFVTINEKTFRYRLPIAELVMKKVCPTDNEKLNGNWDYCPWHGTKLN